MCTADQLGYDVVTETEDAHRICVLLAKELIEFDIRFDNLPINNDESKQDDAQSEPTAAAAVEAPVRPRRPQRKGKRQGKSGSKKNQPRNSNGASTSTSQPTPQQPNAESDKAVRLAAEEKSEADMRITDVIVGSRGKQLRPSLYA